MWQTCVRAAIAGAEARFSQHWHVKLNLNEFQLENENSIFNQKWISHLQVKKWRCFLFTEIRISNSKKSEFNTEALGATHTDQFRSVWSIILFWKYAIQKQEENIEKSPGTWEVTWNHCLLHPLQRKDLPHMWHHCQRNMNKFPVEHFLDMLDIKCQMNIRTPRRSSKNR